MLSDRRREYKEIMSKLKVGMNVYDTRKGIYSIITGIGNCPHRIEDDDFHSCNECIGWIQLDNGEYECYSLTYNFWLTIVECDDFLSEEDMEI